MRHRRSAALFMAGSAIGFGLMAVTIRLASVRVDTWEVAFFRNLFGLGTLMAVLVAGRLHRGQPLAGLPASLRSQQLPRYLVRAAFGLASMYCGFWSIAHLPLSQAVALAYASPVFATVAAAIFLGERVRLRRWLAVLAGFIGMLVILRPFSQSFSPGTLVALLAAVLSAIVSIQIKQLSRVDAPDTIVFWTYLLWVLMTLPLALRGWRWPDSRTLEWLALTGVFGTMGQVLWTRALELGDVSALTPISFLQLLVVTIAGVLLFGQALDSATLVGAGIIFASTIYIARREAALAEQARDARQ